MCGEKCSNTGPAPAAPHNKIHVKNYSFIADCSSKVPDDKALVIPQIPVNGQLRLPGNLRERGKKSKLNLKTALKHIHIDYPSPSPQESHVMHTTTAWGALVWRSVKCSEIMQISQKSWNNCRCIFTNQGNLDLFNMGTCMGIWGNNPCT